MSVDTARLVSSPSLDPTYVDDEEQDEPLAGKDHRLTIDALHHALSTRRASEWPTGPTAVIDGLAQDGDPAHQAPCR